MLAVTFFTHVLSDDEEMIISLEFYSMFIYISFLVYK